MLSKSQMRHVFNGICRLSELHVPPCRSRAVPLLRKISEALPPLKKYRTRLNGTRDFSSGSGLNHGAVMNLVQRPAAIMARSKLPCHLPTTGCEKFTGWFRWLASKLSSVVISKIRAASISREGRRRLHWQRICVTCSLEFGPLSEPRWCIHDPVKAYRVD
jgi:hypothetical protein